MSISLRSSRNVEGRSKRNEEKWKWNGTCSYTIRRSSMRNWEGGGTPYKNRNVQRGSKLRLRSKSSGVSVKCNSGRSSSITKEQRLWAIWNRRRSHRISSTISSLSRTRTVYIACTTRLPSRILWRITLGRNLWHEESKNNGKDRWENIKIVSNVPTISFRIGAHQGATPYELGATNRRKRNEEATIERGISAHFADY